MMSPARAVVVISALVLCGGCAHQVQSADANPRMVCRDGTAMTGNGECGGHGGVSERASAEKSHALRERQAAGAAAAGQPDEVWATPAAKTYACRGDADYGKSKEGRYMSESDAVAKGLHPAKGKPCGA